LAIIVYVTQEDLEQALSPATVLALYNDLNNDSVNPTALEGVLIRATTWVDSYLATQYLGPFPVPQTPVPMMIKMAALEFAIAFSFERHPEYVLTYGESFRATARFKRACEIMERIISSQQQIPDWALQPKGKNVGGIINSTGPRTIIDGPNGENNGGDF